ncbi:DNA-directed RNA polymerase subunit beta''-like isoform X2 [Daktulosphaira vitifoliae]|uniref:DNA-directed RNA polymerase subunit beta''-like isoform X2 n=1 Tax=Daktulosphaira vitifoliae TaxID=58002 RepID=UPI0021AAD97B|nr:DNA-directed RNA polymerase subunit beta''-like isoform X2 [Daktulosphaira vitifoliae]
MVLLDDVMYRKTYSFPFTLITLNMYLNNVSDSINIIAQNNEDDKNDANKLLKGYTIIHLAIKEQLTNYINGNCTEISFIDHMVECNPPMVKNKYDITYLLNINNNLTEKILSKFKLTLRRNSYESLHPKNILFYDIMTLQILTNKNNSIKIDNSQRIELNLLRFTPLNVKCSNGTRITIQDVFQYMKYDFNSKDVFQYIKMVIVATFRPIAILIRNYLTLIHVASSKNSDSVKFWIKPTLIEIGRKIINHIEKYISLRLFNNKDTFLYNVLYNFTNILDEFTINNYLLESSHKINNFLMNKLLKIFMENNLYFTTDIYLTNKNINENNADEIKNQIEKIINKVNIYLNDMEKWNKWFYNIVNSFKIRSLNISVFKHFISFKVLDRICNTESHSEIYNASMNDNNKIDIGYYEDKKDVNDGNIEFNLENLKDKDDENNIDANDSFEHQSNYKPLYMIDYWPYNL